MHQYLSENSIRTIFKKNSFVLMECLECCYHPFDFVGGSIEEFIAKEIKRWCLCASLHKETSLGKQHVIVDSWSPSRQAINKEDIKNERNLIN